MLVEEEITEENVVGVRHFTKKIEFMIKQELESYFNQFKIYYLIS